MYKVESYTGCHTTGTCKHVCTLVLFHNSGYEKNLTPASEPSGLAPGMSSALPSFARA